MFDLSIGPEGDQVLRELTVDEVATLQAGAARRQLPKSLVWARIVDLGKAAAAKALLDQDAVAWGRWFAPDWPNVFADDQGLLDFLGAGALGLTEEQISAVTA